MPAPLRAALASLAALALLGLNIAAVSFYTLWAIADTQAIARADAAGFAASLLPPNSHLMWAAANATLVMLLIVDLLAVVSAVLFVAVRRRTTSTPEATLKRESRQPRPR